MKRRAFLSLLLALTMLFSVVPAGIIAEESETVTIVETEPKVEAPKAEEPKAEEPKAEEPKAEEPKAEEPKAEEPAAEAPKAEEPAAEEPKAEEPAAEEPKAEEPAAEEPKAEEPAAEEPKAEEPVAEEPKAEEPAAEEPKAEEPAAEEPKAEEPAAEEPKAEPDYGFKAGLMYLKRGSTVYSDAACKEERLITDAQVGVYALNVVNKKTQPEIGAKDRIRIILNENGKAVEVYVRYGRLAVLTEAQLEKYGKAKHEDAIEYQGVKLDPVSVKVVEEPAAEEPAAEEPKAEEPKTEEPAAEEPKAEEPAAEEPAAEEPAAEEPAAEEPAAEEPAAEEPAAEEPAAEEPKAEEPTAEEPVAEEPKAEEPAAEEPAAEEPAAEEPKAEESAAEEPAAEDPKAEEPAAEEPKAEEPADEIVIDVDGEEVEKIDAADTDDGWQEKPVITKAQQTGSGTVKLTWTAGGVPDRFVIYEVIDGKSQSFKTVVGTANSVTLTNVTAGKHIYRVRAKKAIDGTNVFSPISATKTITVVDDLWKIAPNVTSAKQTANGEVTIAWTAVEAPDKFYIAELIGTAKKGFKSVAGTVNTVTLTDVAVGEHTYYVRSMKKVDGASVYGSYTAAIKVNVVQKDPWTEAPVITRAEQTDEGTVVLEWTAKEDPDKFYIAEYANDKYTGFKSVAGTLRTVTLTDIAEGDHDYAIRAMKKIDGTNKYGDYSTTVKVSVMSGWKVAPVITKLVQTGEGTVELEWTGAEEAPDKYYIAEYANGKYTGFKSVAGTVNAVTLTDITAGVHNYSVRAMKKIDGVNTYGAYAETAKITVMTGWQLPPVITRLVQTGEGTLELEWTGAEEAPDKFYIAEYANDKYSAFKTVSGTVNTVTLTGVTEGEHSYSVRAMKKVDGANTYGAYAEVVMIDVLTGWQIPPVITRAEQTDEGTVVLEWTASEAPDKFYIAEYANDKYTAFKTVSGSVNTVTLTGVADGEHIYAIRPMKKIDNKNTFGAYSQDAVVTVASIWQTEVLTDGTLSIVAYNGAETAINVPEAIGGVTVSAIGEGVFADKTDITSITLPDSISAIGANAFKGCTGIATLRVPAAVTAIPASMCQGCTGLTAVTMPNAVTVIGQAAFKGCTKLANMNCY